MNETIVFDRPGPIAIFAVSAEGASLGRRLLTALPQATLWTSKPFVPEARVYGESLV